MPKFRARLGLLLTACCAEAGIAHASVLSVGGGQAYTTLTAAVSAAHAGDTIDIYPGTYNDQAVYVTVPLTIQGVGGGTPVLAATTPIGNGKGLLVADANLTVNNIAFEDAQVTGPEGENGAGIRYEIGSLVVTNSRFINNQDGILATPGVADTGSVVVENTLFSGNGDASGPGAGFTHAIYAANQIASLTVRNSVFRGTKLGHDIKSRAATTVISGNTLNDGVTGTTSYAVDLPNGGAATITGNTIVQGQNTNNQTMVAYGEEGIKWSNNSLLVTGNTFTNTLSGTSIGVYNHDSAVTAQVTCNAFSGLSNPTKGPASLQSNSFSGSLPACAASPLPEPSGWASLLPAGLVLLLLRRQKRPDPGLG